ncbi:DUF2283 domain-containing protein [Amphibiibacter pelophylacis]|uniref:DUF2283 domain-containing protein n=1 Tax=Amphibiibacter pelophylacis TaxID=1799477 RepID=A0ACC6NZF5_9BURK
MQTTYYGDDDILVMRLSDKPIAREVSQDWNTHISFADDGSTVEIVVLDAAAIGAYPLRVLNGQAA